MAKKRKEIPKLDLHGVKHQNVEVLVENFVLSNENRLPVDIITGMSDTMKKLVTDILDYHGFEHEEGDFFNKGYIHVIR
ncbi:MAG: putative hydrolase [uncultured marine phage]|uniref:Putative hydrolase n=1 Tax=uncultured marine phage TaxID=707152 RepID=A0A8D9FSC8_9VIRU|nr:MAG: putative hydrolase [uncultured marine phage]